MTKSKGSEVFAKDKKTKASGMNGCFYKNLNYSFELF